MMTRERHISDRYVSSISDSLLLKLLLTKLCVTDEIWHVCAHGAVGACHGAMSMGLYGLQTATRNEVKCIAQASGV
jgi:hypothetical protein